MKRLKIKLFDYGKPIFKIKGDNLLEMDKELRRYMKKKYG